MNRAVSLAVALVFFFQAGEASDLAPVHCRPALATLDDPVKLDLGASELSFRLVAVGCDNDLKAAWPPDMAGLEKGLEVDLQEPHPVQILLMIRDRSPELRQRLTHRLNAVLKRPVISDVFLYDAKVAE